MIDNEKLSRGVWMVQCPTPKIFREVIEIYNPKKLTSSDWNHYGERTTVYINGSTHGCYGPPPSNAVKPGWGEYELITFDEFIKRTNAIPEFLITF